MQYRNFLAVVIATATLYAQHASALSYDMQGGLSNPQDCGIQNSYWRTDEVMQDQYGSYTDPYAYGAIPSSDLGYPLNTYDTGSGVYYDDVGSMQDAYASSDVYYGNSGVYAGGVGSSVDAIALANLQRATQGSTTGTGSGMGGRGGSGGGVRLAQATTATAKAPSCTLIPRATGSNSVVLEWQTVGASSAFIDNGVGHVVLGTGTRTVTPRVTTTYNMTVVDGRGFANQCQAIVHVVNGGTIDAATTIVNGNAGSTTSGTATGSETTQTDSTAVNTDSSSNADAVSTVTNTASKVGGNVSDKVTSLLSTGEGVWSKMRQMSLVAIGLFFVIFIIMFVMRKMFGGGDEGGHH